MERFGFALLFVLGCGGGSLKKSGEACVATSECDKGLLCDVGKHVCADHGSLDAAVIVDSPRTSDAGADARVDARPDASPLDAALDAPVADAPLD